MICGGTISGNWATGSPAMATSPPMTVTMAMAIATIGRLMKSFGIIDSVLFNSHDGPEIPPPLSDGQAAGVNHPSGPERFSNPPSDRALKAVQSEFCQQL